MNGMLWFNFVAFLVVTFYAVGLFIYLIRTRASYIKLGKKVEFERNVKERLRKIGVHVFGQRKLLQDKKVESYMSCFSMDLFWFNLEPLILL